MKRLIPLSTKISAISVCLTGLLGSLILSGCASTVPMNYSPSSVKTATGALSVSDFIYQPAAADAAKLIPPNVIKNTAMGQIKIDRNVNVFVRDAVFAELRFVGIKRMTTGRYYLAI